MTPEAPETLTREELVALVKAQAATLEAQAAEIAALKAQVANLTALVAELQRRLGLNSSNSSKPPSSDGLKKPARVSSLRERSERKPGGQKGHKGETLCQAAEPDRVIDHYPDACTYCGAPLTPAMAEGHVARQVFDLPQPQPPEVTAHHAHACRCTHCKGMTQAAFPEGVNAPVQYGPRIAAFVAYLLHFQMLPEDRLVTLMRDLFGISLCAATIANMSRACARRVEGFSQTVRDLVAGAPVKHMDETGFRIAGKTQWLHVSCTALLTFYHVCAKRSGLLSTIVKVVGTIVHDHWRPYDTMEGVRHALCNAHHLRELKALVEIEKEDWARRMQILLRRACHATNLARARGDPVNPRLIALFERRYEAITRQGLAFHESLPPIETAASRKASKRRGRQPHRTGHNLLIRLTTRKQDVLRFLHDPTVPFTNNEAERDGRMMKLRQKISGGFRSPQGATDFAIIRSFLATARKQGWNIINALTADQQTLIQALRTA